MDIEQTLTYKLCRAHELPSVITPSGTNLVEFAKNIEFSLQRLILRGETDFKRTIVYAHVFPSLVSNNKTFGIQLVQNLPHVFGDPDEILGLMTEDDQVRMVEDAKTFTMTCISAMVSFFYDKGKDFEKTLPPRNLAQNEINLLFGLSRAMFPSDDLVIVVTERSKDGDAIDVWGIAQIEEHVVEHLIKVHGRN